MVKIDLPNGSRMQLTGDEETVLIDLADGRCFELWSDGHFQLWSPETMIVEGDLPASTVSTRGSRPGGIAR